jgi:integrase/recombinase XerD
MSLSTVACRCDQTSIAAVVSLYLSHKRALGYRFHAEGFILRAFCKAVGDAPMNDVESGAVLDFLNGDGPVTETWVKKYHVLSGFYRFAMARGLAISAPLPRQIAIPAVPAFVPYIYSKDELKRLIDAAPVACAGRCHIDPYVFRVLLLLLYGAGLRLGEALSLTMADVDFGQAILRVRETKCFKSRLVPAGRDLSKILSEYMSKRSDGCPATGDTPFFCFRDGRPLSGPATESAFRRLRSFAGIQREGGPRRQPRLHDLRHTAAVHRVIAWYRTGADVQDLLPKLATYLGHVDLTATQRYLTMTPELLREAGLRFERYAMEAGHV